MTSLAAPWLLLVLLSVGEAVLTAQSLQQQQQEEQEEYYEPAYIPRWLQQAGHYVFDETHKPLWPLDRSDASGLVLAVLGLMIAAGGGIGGGGILVPLYILVMGFSPKHAIPLSNVTVLGGAVANTMLNAAKRHPLADRPLVDWDLILVMEPLTIAGALMGAFLNKLLPEQILVILLVVLLLMTAYKTLKKAIKMYKLESRTMREEHQRIMQQAQQARIVPVGVTPSSSSLSRSTNTTPNRPTAAIPTGQQTPLSAPSNTSGSKQPDGSMKETELTAIDAPQNTVDIVSPPTSPNTVMEPKDNLLLHMELQDGECPGDGSQLGDSVNSELRKLLEKEREMPVDNLKILIVMFVVVLILNLAKGGGAFPSPLGIRCGSPAFWTANLLMLLWILSISLVARSVLVRKYNTKRRLQFPYVEGDIRWDPTATIVYPLICCAAGFFAGMFGIGGGIVKGPLMLAMGVHPAVSAASSACMILFTSFTATTSFVVFGLLVPDYAAVCLVVGFLATYVGQIGLNYIMKRSRRNSYIAFSIGGVVLLSAFLMTIQSLIAMAESSHHHSGGICGVDD